MSDYYEDKHKYDDIINMSHHQSVNRPHMSLHDRAAQFAPFSALTGYDEAIKETSRLTEEKIELDETEIKEINKKIEIISKNMHYKTPIIITYFNPDKNKNGGAYLTDIGTVKKIDTFEQIIIMDNNIKIPMEQIVSIKIK